MRLTCSSQACNTMTRFPPSSPLPPASTSTSSDSPSIPSTELVPTRLTRPLYSQLLLQKFYAPKPFEKVGWNEGKLGDEDVRRRDLGMKIVRNFLPQLEPYRSISNTDEVPALFVARLAVSKCSTNKPLLCLVSTRPLPPPSTHQRIQNTRVCSRA
jgi:hypothetical protein